MKELWEHATTSGGADNLDQGQIYSGSVEDAGTIGIASTDRNAIYNNSGMIGNKHNRCSNEWTEHNNRIEECGYDK